MSDFLNPYNFVRPLAAPKPTTPVQHLLWRCPPPPHDRYVGLSGRITCKMTAETPVFISNGEPLKKEGEHPSYEFYKVDGKDTIPGSSLRGAIRSVFEGITNSTYGVFEGYKPLFYRMDPSKALGLVPGMIVTDKRNRWYFLPLNGKFDIQAESKNLYAAWIPCYPNEEKLSQSEMKRKHMLSQADLVKIPQAAAEGQQCYAAVRKTRNLKDKGFPHYQADFIHPNEGEVKKFKNSSRFRDDYEIVEGFAYVTGLNIDKKQYERFFIVASKKALPLTEKVIETYDALMQDYDSRKESIDNSLKEDDGKKGKKRKGIKASVFIGAGWRLQPGRLVYAKLRQSSEGLLVMGLYPVAIPRTAYERCPADVVQAFDPHLLPPTNFNELCLASRVFGWVSQDADDGDLSQRVAYKGRVRFSHAQPTKTPTTLDYTLDILGTPHPTSVEFYLSGVKTAKPVKSPHGYDEREVRVRGRKMYRHHGKQPTPNAEKSKFNRTILGAHDKGTTYTFTIEFENLQPVELGALLYTLQLEDGAFHRIGYGKPLGLGSVKMEVENLTLIPMENRYLSTTSWLTNERENITSRVRELTLLFMQEFSRLYKGQPDKFHDLDNIKDLMALLKEPANQLPVQYPRPRQGYGYEWFMNNKDNKDGRAVQVIPVAAEDTVGLAYNGKK